MNESNLCPIRSPTTKVPAHPSMSQSRPDLQPTTKVSAHPSMSQSRPDPQPTTKGAVPYDSPAHLSSVHGSVYVARMSRARENRVKRNYSSFYFRADSATQAVRLPNQTAADTYKNKWIMIVVG